MYDELVKRLRRCEQFRCRECEYENVIGCRAKLNAEAADAIEELTRRCEQFQYMPPPAWIPVKERLPDFEGCVLCLRKAFVGDKLRYQDILYYEEGTFYMEFEDTPIPTEAVTHWMPLPTPPPKGE